MYTVEIDKVRKAYGNFVAVDDLSLQIRTGAVFGLLGPNGAGKTSTIRMMIQITAPDSGSIRMFDEEQKRAHLRRIGYLPEERGLYKKMNVLEQLVFFGELQGIGHGEAERRAKHWCDRLEIAVAMNKKVEELSKGMQQKIQFIAALLHDPEFVILDEPFSGLDPVNATLLKDVILDLKKQKKTILFSSHRMDTVEKLCDSIALVNRGRIVLAGDLREVKSRYGKSHVQIDYDGDGSFLEKGELVQSFNNYGNYVEIRMAPGADAQMILQAAAQRSRVNKFEVVEPSLEEIFIDIVGKDALEEVKA